MSTPPASRLDAPGGWRAAIDDRLIAFGAFLAEHGLDDGDTAARIDVLRSKLADDRLMVAVVGEVSRGKSELVNALLFADGGGRLLPAAPGRTTLCPVEIGYDARQPPSLALLPVETWCHGVSLADCVGRPELWTHVALDPGDLAGTAAALREVTRLRRVSRAEAVALGLATGGAGATPTLPASATTVDIELELEPGVDLALDLGTNTDLALGPDTGREELDLDLDLDLDVEADGDMAVGAPPDAPGPAPLRAEVAVAPDADVDADPDVDLPLWRHAVLNHPHPLLAHGLVVIDTPGLNAPAAGSEATLELLPRVHAVVVVLAADAGVTASDLAFWRSHLVPEDAAGGADSLPFVVLNKIDALRDPLSDAAGIAACIDAQRDAVAYHLGMPPARVFAVSARDAVVARATGDAVRFAVSGLPALERALGHELLPRQQALRAEAVNAVVRRLHAQATHRLDGQRRQVAEQLAELRSLRGKSSARQQALMRRAAAEAADVERCATQLRALRALQARMLADALGTLASERVDENLAGLRQAARAAWLPAGLRKAFDAMCRRLEGALATAQTRSDELHAMLAAAIEPLNAEFALGLTAMPRPDLADARRALADVERGFARHLGLGTALRRGESVLDGPPGRWLDGELRALFNDAVGRIDSAGRTLLTQIDAQLQERRGSFRRRREALERIETAEGDLAKRIGELEAQEARLARVQGQLDTLAGALRGLPPSPVSPAATAALRRPEMTAAAVPSPA